MGSQPIQLLTQFSVPISQNWNYHRGFEDDNFTASRARWWQCFSGSRSGGSRWERDKKENPNRWFRFSDSYVTNEYDEEDGFGFRNTAKQRVWRSDEEEEDEGFGILEASIGFNWVFKFFRAFGWMIPAVIISLVMGTGVTGPNGIIMALALPLAQSALSLVAETLWGRADETPRPRKRSSKKRPFAGAQRRTRVRKEKEICSQTRKEAGNNYKSWLEGNNVSSKQEMNWQDFGGWDELDRRVRSDEEPCTTSVKQGDDEPRAEERLKISRRTKGDSQLFMRFLIAMFPFLGFWTKLF